PFVHQEGWQDILNHDAMGFEAVRSKCLSNLQPWLFDCRCWLHEMTSLEAAKLLPGATNHATTPVLDFVYLDARHDYESVYADLNAWGDRIKPGGIFCGHDYLDCTIGDTVFGVKPAVQLWARQHGYPLTDIRVTDDGNYPSWYIRIR